MKCLAGFLNKQQYADTNRNKRIFSGVKLSLTLGFVITVYGKMLYTT